MRFSLLLALIVLLAGYVGCRTAPIPEFEPIAVPEGLSAQQIELAILSGILNKPPPAQIDPLQTYSDEQFQRLIWEHFLRDAQSRSWFPESTAPGVVYAAVNTRGHYLRVALVFDESAIRTEIVETKNLMQSEGEIHARALKWIENLHDHIRRELSRLAFASKPAARHRSGPVVSSDGDRPSGNAVARLR